jgi:hypothetical protein
MNMGGLFLSLYEFLQLRNIDPSVIKKYPGIVGNEVAWECLGGLNLDFALLCDLATSSCIQDTA